MKRIMLAATGYETTLRKLETDLNSSGEVRDGNGIFFPPENSSKAWKMK